jgi:hypothetical protein
LARDAKADDSSLESRLDRVAASLGCPADLEAITATLLQQTALGDSSYEAVWSSVDHLVNHDAAWRLMEKGVLPPSLRSQAVRLTYRTSPTTPGDSVPALVFAAVGEAILSSAQTSRTRRSLSR